MGEGDLFFPSAEDEKNAGEKVAARNGSGTGRFAGRALTTEEDPRIEQRAENCLIKLDNINRQRATQIKMLGRQHTQSLAVPAGGDLTEKLCGATEGPEAFPARPGKRFFAVRPERICRSANHLHPFLFPQLLAFWPCPLVSTSDRLALRQPTVPLSRCQPCCTSRFVTERGEVLWTPKGAPPPGRKKGRSP